MKKEKEYYKDIDSMFEDMLSIGSNEPEINPREIDFDEVVEVLDVLDCYDEEVEIIGYDKKGNCYSAIATRSCGEIVEIDETTIEKLKQ